MEDNKFMLMDETDAPYEKGERPCERTLEDDIFILEMAKKYNLEFKPDSRLGKLNNQING